MSIQTMPQQGAALTPAELDPQMLGEVLVNGNIAGLTPRHRLDYYKMRCEVAGLDPRAQPFQFVQLNGKLVLYPTKSATDQIAAKRGIQMAVVSHVNENDLRVTTVKATMPDGRSTEEIGAVSIKGLMGEALANAYMKAITKAKRRAILSLCGMGGDVDEGDVRPVRFDPATGVIEVAPEPPPAETRSAAEIKAAAAAANAADLAARAAARPHAQPSLPSLPPFLEAVRTAAKAAGVDNMRVLTHALVESTGRVDARLDNVSEVEATNAVAYFEGVRQQRASAPQAA